jgi:hypothetical protein
MSNRDTFHAPYVDKVPPRPRPCHAVRMFAKGSLCSVHVHCVTIAMPYKGASPLIYDMNAGAIAAVGKRGHIIW